MRRLLQLLTRHRIYRRLCAKRKQFRMLTILPGHQSAKVCCVLHTASLDHGISPSYETISYAWGDSTHRGSIRVNGATLDVPYNTMAALRRVRSPEGKRVVWIDAVCIKQTDLEERSAQVAMMGTIYANGRKNLVFLGDDENSVARGVVEVLDASRQRIKVALDGLCEEERMSLREGWHVESFDNNRILEGMDNDQYVLLYSLPWFRRLWVLQEASLAVQSRCYWGSSEFMLADVLLLARVLEYASLDVTDIRDTAYLGLCAAIEMHKPIERLRNTNAAYREVSFWDLVERARKFQAKDPRDYVFAPLQLYVARIGRSLIPPWLLPDYHKSVEEVFRDATQYVLLYETRRRDGVLAEISHRSLEDLKAGLPSWVVRVNRRFSSSHDPNFMPFHGSGFREDDGDSPELLLQHFSEEPDILGLFVHKVDSVSQITLVLPSDGTEEDLAKMQKIMGGVAALSGFGDELLADLLLRGDMESSFRDEEHQLEGYHRFLDHMQQNGVPYPIFEDESSGDHWWAARLFWNTLSQMSNRRFFRTINGYLGWGPALMQESDILVVAQGASVPYILRPVESKYLLLGHAWVQDLMNGEVFDLDGEWDWIRIC